MEYILRWLPGLGLAAVLLGYAYFLRRKIRRAERSALQLKLTLPYSSEPYSVTASRSVSYRDQRRAS